MEVWHTAPIGAAVQADVSTALFAVFDAMPLGAIMSIVATVLVLVFFVTSGDSATLVLGMMSTGGNPDPGAGVKIVWGVLIGAIAASLLLTGGVQALQTATIVFALPFIVVIVLMAISLWRAVRDDWHQQQREERALRSRLREIAGKK